jgi:hypothetical protein
MAVYAAMLAVSGFTFGMITNSIGGDVAGNPSGFENIVRHLRRRDPGHVLPADVAEPHIIVVGVLSLVIGATARGSAHAEKLDVSR